MLKYRHGFDARIDDRFTERSAWGRARSRQQAAEIGGIFSMKLA